MSNAPFPINPDLTAVAILYKNQRMIADEVLPRTPVGKSEFKYLKHNLADGFTIPETKVGRKSRANKVEYSATEITESTVNHALEQDVPQEDIMNADPRIDPMKRATEQIMDLIQLRREVEVANIMFNLNTYPSTHRVTLSGTSQLSDFVNSDPLGVLQAALDKPLMRPRSVALGRDVWSVIKRHPKVVKAVYPISQGGDGMLAREAIRDLLELEQFLVGESWLNTAKKGQTPTLNQAWGKHIAFFYSDVLAGPQQGTTFGFTAEFGGPVAYSWEDKTMGLHGGTVVKAGESTVPVISANDLGYFIQNAVA